MKEDACLSVEKEAEMTSLSPLQIASTAVQGLIGYEVPVGEDDRNFGLVFNNLRRKDLPDYETMFHWRRAGLGLDFGIASHFDLAPLRNKDRLCAKLNNNIRPFLDGLYEGSGRLVLHAEFDTIIPVYEVKIDYAPLEDQEIRSVVEDCFVRGLRTLSLLVPVFECIERGYVPDAEERMTLLTLEHGIWEVNATASDVPEHGVRFPHGLFGDIGIPPVQ